MLVEIVKRIHAEAVAEGRASALADILKVLREHRYLFSTYHAATCSCGEKFSGISGVDPITKFVNELYVAHIEKLVKEGK